MITNIRQIYLNKFLHSISTDYNQAFKSSIYLHQAKLLIIIYFGLSIIHVTK